jgi:hypothetical protein
VGLLPFLVITLTLFAKSPIDTATSLTGNAAVAEQPYPYLQPFPSTTTGQMQIQQSQQPSNLNAPNSVPIGNSNTNNPFQNLQNQIDQLKAIISNLHGQKLVVTERFAPDFVNGYPPTESKAVCNSDEVVTGGGWLTTGNIPPSPNEIGVVKSNASGNGWVVQMIGMSFKAVAECAKLS